MTIFSDNFLKCEGIVGLFSGTTIGVGAIILAITQFIIPFFKTSISASIALSNKIVGETKLPNYVDKLGVRAEISSDLDILFDAWIGKKEGKVIIFVDELDRCTEKGVIEFFQSIQLLIENEKLHFVFAIDEDVLKNGIIN